MTRPASRPIQSLVRRWGPRFSGPRSSPAAHGLRAIYVRANWNGHRDGFGSHIKTEFPEMDPRHCRVCSVRELDQRRIRFSRDIGCRLHAHRGQFALVRRALRHHDCLFDGPFPLLSNRKDLEMAGAVSLCLRRNGSRRFARHIHQCLAESRRHPRDHHQPLSVFLADVRRSGRKESGWVAEYCGNAKAQRDRRSRIENSMLESVHFFPTS
jgi:hypothetical protein